MRSRANSMTALLPALPATADLVTADLALMLERQVASQIAHINDIDVADEWRRRAEALATYLAGTDGHGPMLGALRRTEARIGQLLGASPGSGKRETPRAEFIHYERRREFRTLADAVDEGLLAYEDDDDESPWRASRRALLLAALLRDLSGVKGSVTVEWYTPGRYIEAAREVLGGIDLDPASSELANETVQADEIFTQDEDGLVADWHGRVWLNPPYGKGTGLFTTKLVEEHAAGRVSAAVLLINAYGFDSGWFQPLWNHLLCFTDHRIIFTSPQRGTGGPANANLFVYLGPDAQRFAEVFSEFGAIVRRVA
jgi:hypothetical protein